MNKTIDPPMSGFSFTRTGINTMKPSSIQEAQEYAEVYLKEYYLVISV
jgi:hypothetical protein